MSNDNRNPLGWRSLDWGVIVTLLTQMVFLVYWATTLEAQVQTNTRDIEEVQRQMNAVDTDIRAILVGIEQIKARVGVVESTRNQ